VILSGTFPPYTHDFCVVGDDRGKTIATSTLVGFGAGLALASIVMALIFYKKRGELPSSAQLDPGEGPVSSVEFAANVGEGH